MMKEIFVEKNTYDKPDIQLTVKRVEPSAWHSLGFDKHHYLTSSLNKSCKCFVFFWNEEPCAFIALLNSPRKGHPEGMSISRIVVLPDFQGIGIGKMAIEFICGIATNNGNTVTIKTIHENFGKYLTNSSLWTPTSYNGKVRKDKKKFEEGKYNNRLMRASYCFKYIGKPIKGYEELMQPIKVLREKKAMV